MTPGLKILIERMREHPEDFMADPYTDYALGSKLRRWNDLISITNSMVEEGHFSDEEVQAWNTAKKRLSLDTYNARVLDAVNYVPPEPVGYPEPAGLLGSGQQYAQNAATGKLIVNRAQLEIAQKLVQGGRS